MAHAFRWRKPRGHIARALAQQPNILLLNEPTNHLDIQHQLSILGLVKDLPLSSVVALHDLMVVRVGDA